MTLRFATAVVCFVSTLAAFIAWAEQREVRAVVYGAIAVTTLTGLFVTA